MTPSVLTQRFIQPLAATALGYVKKMPSGGSDSRLLRCDAGQFVTKFRGNPQGTRILANELVTALLALLIGIPCSAPAIVTVTPEFAQANQQVLSPYGTGRHFGSQLLGSEEHPTGTLSQATAGPLVGRNDLVGIMALDLWVGNTDRKEEHVLLHQDHLYPIDHGNTFTNPTWTADLLLRDMVRIEPTWPLKRLLSGIVRHECLDKLQQLEPEAIKAVVAEVPEEWGLSSTERNAMVEFLVHRRSLAARTVEGMTA